MQFFLFFGIIVVISGEERGGMVKTSCERGREREMLVGEYNHTIDVKGRVNFPARLREDLGEEFYVTKGLDGCLFVYSKEEFSRLDQKIAEAPTISAEKIRRYFFSRAICVSPDKQGRILIPQGLREHAGLEKDVVVVGVSIRAEIWDKERWEKACSELSDDVIREEFARLGI